LNEPSGYLEQECTEQIIGAAIEVHKALGPGLLESAYQACLEQELESLGVPYQTQMSLPVRYRELVLEVGYRIDLLVADKVIVEVKSVERFDAVHEAQLLTYLRLSNKRVGLLLYFNVPRLRDGINRRVL